METLTDHECSEWLAAKGLTENPYALPNRGEGPYLQVPLERVSLPYLVELNDLFQTALLHITDWAHYSQDQMAVVTELRKASGEERWLIHTPGHVFHGDENDLLAGWMRLVVSYGWTAYVYFDHGLTLLLWEGVLMDLWCDDLERFQLHEQWLGSLQKPDNTDQVATP